jgi:hypothetical protein
MIRILAWREQIARVGDIDAGTRAALANALRDGEKGSRTSGNASAPRAGSVLVREHDGALHRVMVLDQGYAWDGHVFNSLSAVAQAITGTKWNGPRFFGLDQKAKSPDRGDRSKAAVAVPSSRQAASTRVAQRKESAATQVAKGINCADRTDRLDGAPT